MTTRIGQLREIWRYPVKSMAGESLSRCAIYTQGLSGDRAWALRDEASGDIRGAKKWPALLLCQARYRSAPGPWRIPPAEICLPDGRSFMADDPEAAAALGNLLGAALTLWPLQPASDLRHYRRRQPGATQVGLLGRSRLLRRLLFSLIGRSSAAAGLRQELGLEAGEPLPDLATLPGELLEFNTPPGTYFDAYPLHLLTTSALATMQRIQPDADWNHRRFRPNLLIESLDSATDESTWEGRLLRIGRLVLRITIPTIRCGMVSHAQAGLARDPGILRTVVREAAQKLGSYAEVVDPAAVHIGDEVILL